MTAPTLAGRPLVRLEDALEQMLAGVEPLAVEEVLLDDALGRVLAAGIEARLTLPPWDNSAMDGFALRAADIASATLAEALVLPVRGEAAAGAARETLEPGSALRIYTGAPLPDGADAVVPIEDTAAAPGPATVAFSAPTRAGAHVRLAGSDIRAGDRLLEPGRRLQPAHLALAAAGGHGRLPVRRQPRLAVLATGNELAPAGAALGPAQIPDSNTVGIVAQARAAGALARSFGIARDSLAEVTARLQQAADWADLVVVSGGVSVGAHDVVKDAFTQLGQLELWRVAVQPGKPFAFGRTAGARPVLLFGLPGNPVSTFVTFELFVRPVLRRLEGCADLGGRQVVRAHLDAEVRKPIDRRSFLRVVLVDGEARLAGGQGSHMLGALARANGLAIVPEGIAGLPAGAEVDVLRLDGELDG